MTLHLELPAEVEGALRAQAAAVGKDVASFVAEVVADRLAEPGDEARNPPRHGRSTQPFAERLQAWVDLHPRSAGTVDDSRESIYSGRGE